MEEQKKKINPQSVVIIILFLIVLVFAYNQWGKGFLPGLNSKSGTPKLANIKTQVSEEDIKIGNANAPVTIVEYYSYVCDFCKQFEDEVKPLIVENYISSGKVKLILRPFPPYELSQAVLCANEQGKFLEYHNYLFNNIANLQNAEDLKTFAQNAGLNESEFSQCYDSDKYKAKAEEWYKQGMEDFKKANIPSAQQGTPTFFINGEPLVGVQSYDKLAEVIESKLAK